MTSPQQWDDLAGSTAPDSEGGKAGQAGQIYVNDATGEPERVTVHTGLFGTRESVAPLYGDEADALCRHYAGYTSPASTPAGIGGPAGDSAGTGPAETGYAVEPGPG